MAIGIYKLYFENTDSIYIGQSLNIKNRYQKHINILRLKKHDCALLQQACNLYGEPKLEIMQICLKSELDILEMKYIGESTNKAICNNNGTVLIRVTPLRFTKEQHIKLGELARKEGFNSVISMLTKKAIDLI